MSFRVTFGIEPLDIGAPEGVMRSSTLLVAGESGTGKSALIAHIAANFMFKGEKCIYIALDDSPESFVEQLESFGWPGREFYSKELLHIIDGYTYTTGRYVASAYSRKSINVQKMDELVYSVLSSIDELKLENTGVLVIDSLNDLFYFHDIPKIVMLIKSIRAHASKLRKIVSIMVLHTDTDEMMSLERNIEHLFDGVIYTRVNEDLRKIGIPLKELLIKKLRGAPTNPFWIPYAVTNKGVFPVDMDKLMHLIKSKLGEYERFTRVESRD
ncbi:MAG: RAD55 family ATPase [Sulfolobales archaeon]|nr:RAD55 family ATPase [Sulfolobales archaeon]MDW8083499.1 RAD55 family ATPase [Sulfolobales archaeon]